MTDSLQLRAFGNVILPEHCGIAWDRMTNAAEDDLWNLIRNLPQFDFYTGNNAELLHADEDYSFNIGVWDKHWKAICADLETAGKFEAKKDYASACKMYEDFVTCQTWVADVYVRLAKIYDMANLFKDEKRLLDHAIAHLIHVRDTMAAYVRWLGERYDCLAYVNKRISEGKMIAYYEAHFPLYNPYPEIETLLTKRKALDSQPFKT